MEETKKSKLIKWLKEQGREYPEQYITLLVDNQDMLDIERITFRGRDAHYKANYIQKVYNDELLLEKAPHIRIVGWE